MSCFSLAKPRIFDSLIAIFAVVVMTHHGIAQNSEAHPTLLVKKCDDFAISGRGDHATWNATKWVSMTQLDSSVNRYATRFKIQYSNTGVYVLFHGIDRKITTQNFKDFESIFNGDVFEVFFHPDPRVPVYYEYEVNALSKELILAISNLSGQSFQAWTPKKSLIKKLVHVDNGSPAINASITSWSAEIYFPFDALAIIPKVPPIAGTEWHANFCRLDYDTGKMIKWSFSPDIKTSFHELDAFYTIKFE